jgi:hypothetical protein
MRMCLPQLEFYPSVMQVNRQRNNSTLCEKERWNIKQGANVHKLPFVMKKCKVGAPPV